MSRRPRRLTVAFVAVLIALAASLVAAPTASAAGAGVITCTATLPAFPSNATLFQTNNTGSCNGTWAGATTNAPGTVTGPFTANFAYGEPCPPVAGVANGTANFRNAAGTVIDSQPFSWVRVGLTAVLVLDVGSAAAVFVPTNPNTGHVTGCPGPSVNALVVAAGAWAP